MFSCVFFFFLCALYCANNIERLQSDYKINLTFQGKSSQSFKCAFASDVQIEKRLNIGKFTYDCDLLDIDAKVDLPTTGIK